MSNIDTQTIDTILKRSMFDIGGRIVDPAVTRQMSDALTNLENEFGRIVAATYNVRAATQAAAKRAVAVRRENQLEAKGSQLTVNEGSISTTRTIAIVTDLIKGLTKLTGSIDDLDLSPEQQSAEQPDADSDGERKRKKGKKGTPRDGATPRRMGGRAKIAAVAAIGVTALGFAAARSINQNQTRQVQPNTKNSEGFADYFMKMLGSAGSFIGGLFGGGGFSGSDGSQGAGSTENAEKAMKFFMSKNGGGWTREQAAAIVGNLQAESGANLNPNAIRENDAGPGLHSRGIAQWNRERYQALLDYAKRTGKPWNDFQTQLEFVSQELSGTHKGAGDALRMATTPEQGAEIINRRYEISADRSGKRAANARALFAGLANVTVGPNSSMTGGQGTFTSGFGMRNGRMHRGIDIGVASGTPVFALKGGRAKIPAYDADGYGKWIIVDHGDGSSTRYAHLSSFSVTDGQVVKAGQRLGGVGNTGRSTGPHLHFEYRQGDTAVNPAEIYKQNKWIVGGKEIAQAQPAPKPAAKPKTALPVMPSKGSMRTDARAQGRAMMAAANNGGAGRELAAVALPSR